LTDLSNITDTSAVTAPPPGTFRFGRNWQRYVADYLDPNRERIAAESLRRLVGDISGRTFLDIGCGSGLFSLCAHRAGAAQVISLDVDGDSVAATRELHARAGSPESWRVLHGSILDAAFVEALPVADFVYSWGVLHHTGDMYAAIRNAASLVASDGTFVIAIYNRVTERWLTSERWLSIKRAYNRAPRIGQVGMEAAFVLLQILRGMRRGKSPLRVSREYREANRGMALWTDAADWLGGYPFEFATVDEIVRFCERMLGFSCSKVIPVSARDTGNSEFVFQRSRD
jgi:SAM-dependent methyltransferase